MVKYGCCCSSKPYSGTLMMLGWRSEASILNSCARERRKSLPSSEGSDGVFSNEVFTFFQGDGVPRQSVIGAVNDAHAAMPDIVEYLIPAANTLNNGL